MFDIGIGIGITSNTIKPCTMYNTAYTEVSYRVIHESGNLHKTHESQQLRIFSELVSREIKENVK